LHLFATTRCRSETRGCRQRSHGTQLAKPGLGPFFIDRVGFAHGCSIAWVSQSGWHRLLACVLPPREVTGRLRTCRTGPVPRVFERWTGYVRSTWHPLVAPGRSRFRSEKSCPAARLQRADRSRRRHRSGGTRSVVRARSLGGEGETKVERTKEIANCRIVLRLRSAPCACQRGTLSLSKGKLQIEETAGTNSSPLTGEVGLQAR
jgi:hypothetical protein